MNRIDRMTAEVVASALVLVAVSALVPSAWAASVADQPCEQGRRALPTLTVEIVERHRAYRTSESARVKVLVTRTTHDEEMPAADVSVGVTLSQGDVHRGGVATSDESGVAVVRIPLGWFRTGHLDVRASAWRQLTPRLSCLPELGETGEDVALDLLRVVRR